MTLSHFWQERHQEDAYDVVRFSIGILFSYRSRVSMFEMLLFTSKIQENRQASSGKYLKFSSSLVTLDFLLYFI